MDMRNLGALCVEWERRARNKLRSAELEKDAMGRRLIEHGAMCYFNCAQELKTALEDPLQQKQELPSGDRT